MSNNSTEEFPSLIKISEPVNCPRTDFDDLGTFTMPLCLFFFLYDYASVMYGQLLIAPEPSDNMSAEYISNSFL